MSICLSIIVNERNIFCLAWKSDTSLATQNKRNLVGDRLVVESFKQKYGISDGYKNT